MARKLIFLLLFALFFSCILMAQQWWERKPHADWSEEQADQILNNSPWVGLSVAQLNRAEHESLTAVGLQPNWPVNYRIRLLTARPVREALLTVISFAGGTAYEPGAEATIKVGERKPGDVEVKRQARLKELMDENPDDILVKGDDENIVVTITLTQFLQGWLPGQYEVQQHSGVGSDRNPQMIGIEPSRRKPGWQEAARPEILMRLRSSDLTGCTFLSTKNGKRVPVIRYDPPAMDALGGRFQFSRKLPDGTPFVTPGDKELQFETCINGKQVKVKFDLRKMIYKGKLEI
jgi:hypothetical protein